MNYNIAEIREYVPGDIPALKALWKDCFGDSDEIIDGFFEHLRGMGTGFVAERRGEILGMAFLLYAEAWSEKLRCRERLGYIYAVAVGEKWRRNGIGEELVSECLHHASKSDIYMCCTLPANEHLYEWYKAVGGLSTESFCTFETVEASGTEIDIAELEPDEYGFMRDDILRNEAFVHFYYSYLLYNEVICRSCGGGYYGYNGGLVCAYPDGDTLLVKEALNDAPEFIPALCKRLGVRKALVRRASPSGEPFICATVLMPYNTQWNLTLD